MTALVSFDRVFEVLDLKPMIAETPDAVAIARGPVAVEFDHVDFSYPTAEEVSLASLESVAVLDETPSSQVLSDISFRSNRASSSRSSARRGPARRRSASSSRGSTTSAAAPSA